MDNDEKIPDNSKKKILTKERPFLRKRTRRIAAIAKRERKNAVCSAQGVPEGG
jgi:hypothetical protein